MSYVQLYDWYIRHWIHAISRDTSTAWLFHNELYILDKEYIEGLENRLMRPQLG